MRHGLEKLLEISGPPLLNQTPTLDGRVTEIAGPLGEGLLAMLSQKNGFYAFESALHVLPSHAVEEQHGLHRWNSESLWKHHYEGLASEHVHFAQDIFGCQFALNRKGVHFFNPETTRYKWLAPNIESWARVLLNDWRVLTGWKIAHEWQDRYGPLPKGARLIPPIMFACGASYEDLESLKVVPDHEVLQIWGPLAVQLKDLPDGSKVRIHIVD